MVRADGNPDHNCSCPPLQRLAGTDNVIVLGADLGGTSTRLVLYDDGHERGRSEGPGGAMRAGLGESIARRLAEFARPLLSREGIVRADTFVVGAAGAGRDTERIELQAALERERLAWRVMVVTDVLNSRRRRQHSAGGAGVLVIAGTGSIAISRMPMVHSVGLEDSAGEGGHKGLPTG